MATAQVLERPVRAGRKLATAKKAKPVAAKKSASSTINLRVDVQTHSLIERARGVLGQNRTDFMLNSARAYAQEVLLSQTNFTLSEKDWAEFQSALEAPTLPTAELVALMASTPPWGD